MKKESVKSVFKRLKVKDVLVDNVFFIIGCVLYSLGVNIFAIPNNIAQSGITGLAIIINYLIPKLQVGLLAFLLNIPLLVLAWFFIGKRFTLKTLWVTGMLSIVIDLAKFLMNKGIIGAYTGDKLLAAMFCGAMCGAGLALIIVRGATSGGTDVIGRLIKNAFPHLSIAKMIMVSDAAIVLAAAIVFRSVDSAMYAAILIFVSSRVMDFILYGTGSGKMLYIFTRNGDLVSEEIVSHGRRGATVIETKGGYTGEKGNLVICAARSSEIPKIRKLVKSADPESFIVLSEANEIYGKGFTPPAGSDESDN